MSNRVSTLVNCMKFCASLSIAAVLISGTPGPPAHALETPRLQAAGYAVPAGRVDELGKSDLPVVLVHDDGRGRYAGDGDQPNRAYRREYYAGPLLLGPPLHYRDYYPYGDCRPIPVHQHRCWVNPSGHRECGRRRISRQVCDWW